MIEKKSAGKAERRRASMRADKEERGRDRARERERSEREEEKKNNKMKALRFLLKARSGER